MSARVQACYDKCQRAIEDASSTGRIVAGWETVVQTLREYELAWDQQIMPKKVGIHPKNRSGNLVGTKAHTLGLKIVKAGWSWVKASTATCVEVPTEGASLQTAIAKNLEVTLLSGGRIPKIGEMTHLGIGGNHSNAFLRSVEAASPTDIAELRGASNCMDRDRIQLDAGIMEASTRGLRWTVISRVAADWPKLIELGQRALNTNAQEAQSETELI